MRIGREHHGAADTLQAKVSTVATIDDSGWRLCIHIRLSYDVNL